MVLQMSKGLRINEPRRERIQRELDLLAEESLLDLIELQELYSYEPEGEAEFNWPGLEQEHIVEDEEEGYPWTWELVG
jgi:hypothetical protein